jgi:multisubunit Na+/H+ antiporter MnhE subunit
MSEGLGVRAGFWLLYWAASFCLWLLFVNTTKVHELWLSALCSVIAATAAETVRAQPFAGFRPRVVWLLQAWREPWYILEGCASIFWAFLKHLFRPEPSVLREVVFDSGGPDPASAARRALAITYTTVPPNFVVLAIDLDKHIMLVHQVSSTETPTMTSNLGAKS